MKIKVTTPTTEKKSFKLLPVRHSDANNYKVLSITLKKKNVTKTIFV